MVNHIDGVKTNNTVTNLEYVTPAENCSHSYHALGNRFPPQRGENHPRSKLTAVQVTEIRALYATGEHSSRQLARQYGVTKAQILNIIHHYQWA